MSNLKLNKKVDEKDLDVIPNEMPVMESNEEVKATNEPIIKEEIQDEGRKLFANKKANIALGITGGIIALLILAAVIFVYVV